MSYVELPAVEHLEYLAAIERNAEALVVAAEIAGLAATVPSCPGWTVSDLLGHMGLVHRWALVNSGRRPEEGQVPKGELDPAPPPDARFDWVRAGVAPLVAALAARAPETPTWTFLPPNTAAFWPRRQAHETTLHRVDAQLAAGLPQPIDAPLAVDAIDEFLALVAHRPPEVGQWEAGETVHLHATDVTGEWLLRRTAEGVEVEPVHAKGTLAVRGPASELLCWMTGRGGAEALELFGEPALAERFRHDVKR